MMSRGFRNFILFLILLGMVGLPVIWAVQSATHGSASYDDRMQNTVDIYKPQLPLEVDEHITLIDIEKEERSFIYTFEVNVSVPKLKEMREYFIKRGQFDFCNSGDLLTYKAAKVHVIARYKSIETDEIQYKTISSVETCEYTKHSSTMISRNANPSIEIDLKNEYLNFFTPIVVDENFSILKLDRLYSIVEIQASAVSIVDAPEKIGRQVLEVFCEETGNGRYELFIKPDDRDEPTISYVISDKNCAAKQVEFEHHWPGSRKIYNVIGK